MVFMVWGFFLFVSVGFFCLLVFGGFLCVGVGGVGGRWLFGVFCVPVKEILIQGILVLQ